MGLAWHDPRYAPKAKEYAEAEAEAREGETGTSDDKPVAPWDWRKQQNNDADEDD